MRKSHISIVACVMVLAIGGMWVIAQEKQKSDAADYFRVRNSWRPVGERPWRGRLAGPFQSFARDLQFFHMSAGG